MKQELMNKAVNYLHYYYGTINNQQVTFDIHLIKPSEDAYKEFPEEFSRKFSQEWDKKTAGCFVQHEGYGSHLFMMEPGFIEENAKVARQILQVINARQNADVLLKQ